MSILSKKQMLETPDKVFEKINVPEWGGDVGVISMSADDRLAYEDMLDEEGKDALHQITFLLTKCVVEDEETLTPCFTAEDIPALRRRSSKAVMAVYKKALEVNKLTKVEAKKIEGE